MTGPYDDNLTEFNNRVAGLVRNFSIRSSDRILVEGCGLGFIIEAFKSAGYPNCFGIENSPHVVAIKDTEADLNTVVVESDTRGGEALKTELTSKTGDSSFDWVITESLLESYDDADLNGLLEAAEEALAKTKPNTNIIHMVLTTEAQVDPMFNQKSLAEWVAVRSTHSWYDYVRREVG
jgi:2-polyprenyl-3-methyl-5-hydroxy-6-metoxy-1,4-benzoquinol methylase